MRRQPLGGKRRVRQFAPLPPSPRIPAQMAVLRITTIKSGLAVDTPVAETEVFRTCSAAARIRDQDLLGDGWALS